MVTIYWTQPEKTDVPIVGYEVRWRYPMDISSQGGVDLLRALSKKTMWQTTVGWYNLGTVRGTEITDARIDNKRLVQIEVRSVSDTGKKSPAAVCFDTLNKPATMPNNCTELKIQRMDEHNIEISWKYIHNQNQSSQAVPGVDPADLEVIKFEIGKRSGTFKIKTVIAWVNQLQQSQGTTAQGQDATEYKFIVRKQDLDLEENKSCEINVCAWNKLGFCGLPATVTFYNGEGNFKKDSEKILRVIEKAEQMKLAYIQRGTADANTVNELLKTIASQAERIMDLHTELKRFITEYYAMLTPSQKRSIHNQYTVVIPNLFLRVHALRGGLQ